ncbi:MAG: hypothetical protein P1R58_10995 [bacterium]|nr:hypothetical protein [bacterium]
MSRHRNNSVVNGFLLNLFSLALGLAAAYFMTIQSLRLDLAAKAEGEVVTRLDKKLNNLEVILKEAVVTKEEFFELSREIEIRLTRIESYLADKAGEKIGNKP